MKADIQKFVRDYIAGNPRQSMQDHLLKELTDWGEKHSDQDRGHRAYRLYVRCLAAKKNALAERIKTKYEHLFPRPDDATVAMGFALMATRRR